MTILHVVICRISSKIFFCGRSAGGGSASPSTPPTGRSNCPCTRVSARRRGQEERQKNAAVLSDRIIRLLRSVKVIRSGIPPPTGEHILTLRVAAVDGDERLLIDVMIKPRYVDYWRDAYEVNQISRADVVNAPYLADVAAKIKGILLSGHVIAYNSWFTEAYLDVPGVEIDGVKEHIDGYTGLAEISEQYGIPYSSVNTVDKAIATLRVYKIIST